MAFKIIRWTGVMWQLKINLFNLCLAICLYLQTIIIHLLSKLFHASIGTTFFLGKDKIYFYVFFVILWEVFSFQGRQGRPKKTTKRRGISFLLTDLASLGSFLNKERKMKSSLLPLVRLNTTYISYYAKANSIWKPCKFHERVTVK